MTKDEKLFYNSLVKRLNKAVDYMDDTKIPNEQKEPHMEELQELMRDMERIRKSYGLNRFEARFGFRVKNKRGK